MGGGPSKTYFDHILSLRAGQDRRGRFKMGVDRYTKAVLTIIAICLVINIVRELLVVNESHAQSHAQPHAQVREAVHVIIDGAEPWSLQNAGPIEVKGRWSRE